MRKNVSLVVIFAVVFSALMFTQSYAQEATADDINRDIQILKVVNLFSLNKAQSEQLIKIVEGGYPKRLKNLSQIRDAMVYYEKEGAPQKYSELKEKDIFISKLEKTNEKIIRDFKGILTPEQKKKAEIIFDIITEDEMKLLIEVGPQLLPSFSNRIGILWDLGIMPVSPDSLTSLLPAALPILLDLMSSLQAKTREKALSVIVQPRTAELLKDRVSKMPEEVKTPEPTPEVKTPEPTPEKKAPEKAPKKKKK